MAKRKINIEIVVDMDSPASKEWKYKAQYLTSEIDDVLAELSSIRLDERYHDTEDALKSGTTYKVTVTDL